MPLSNRSELAIGIYCSRNAEGSLPMEAGLHALMPKRFHHVVVVFCALLRAFCALLRATSNSHWATSCALHFVESTLNLKMTVVGCCVV
jgi:hypothetical protein